MLLSGSGLQACYIEAPHPRGFDVETDCASRARTNPLSGTPSGALSPGDGAFSMPDDSPADLVGIISSMRVALGMALLFGGMLIGAIAAVLGIAGVAGNHAFTLQLWAIVGLAGAVAIPSFVVGARLLRRERESGFRRRA